MKKIFYKNNFIKNILCKINFICNMLFYVHMILCVYCYYGNALYRAHKAAKIMI